MTGYEHKCDEQFFKSLCHSGFWLLCALIYLLSHCSQNIAAEVQLLLVQTTTTRCLQRIHQIKVVQLVVQSAALSTLNYLVDNHFKCSICLDTFKGPNVIPACLHHFCDTSIKDSIQRCGNVCPACRAKIACRRDLRKDRLVLVGYLICSCVNCSAVMVLYL